MRIVSNSFSLSLNAKITNKMDHRNEMPLKPFMLVIKREGKAIEYRPIDAFNREYARGLADMIQSSENCIVTVKTKK